MLTKLGVVLCGVSLSAAVAVAGDRPDWTERAMFTWGEDTYFVGVASCAGSVEEGRNRSYVEARRELARYVQPSTNGAISTQMMYEESPGAGCVPGRINVWRLLKYDNSAKLVREFPKPEPIKPVVLPTPTVKAKTAWLNASWFAWIWPPPLTQECLDRAVSDEALTGWTSPFRSRAHCYMITREEVGLPKPY